MAVTRTALLLLAACASIAHAKSPAGVQRENMLILGQRAGYQEARINPDGSLTVHFEFNDRGRGSNIDGRYQLAANGTPRAADTTGVNYLKAKVDEHFTLDKGKA
jgi:hypothetical protein